MNCTAQNPATHKPPSRLLDHGLDFRTRTAGEVMVPRTRVQGIALDPNFATNNQLFLFYAATGSVPCPATDSGATLCGPQRLSQLVGFMRLLRLDVYFEGAETGTASTADSNAMNNTQGVLPRHEAVWGSFAGP